MKMKMLLSVMLAVLMSVTPLLAAAPLGIGAGAAEAQRSGGAITVPVHGTASPGTADAQDLNGVFTITRFVAGEVGGQRRALAVGTLVMPMIGPNGPTTVVQQIALPVGSGAASPAAAIAQVGCEILHLELGPLDLNLLGLVVHLDEVVLDITAVPGAGNLLGNLLCAIAGLLDGTGAGPLGQLVALLNQLLQILG
jgi:hypothetical protein